MGRYYVIYNPEKDQYLAYRRVGYIVRGYKFSLFWTDSMDIKSDIDDEDVGVYRFPSNNEMDEPSHYTARDSRLREVYEDHLSHNDAGMYLTDDIMWIRCEIALAICGGITTKSVDHTDAWPVDLNIVTT